MDKKYLLSNGSMQIVPLEYEQDFFKLLKEADLTAELITDEPGKFLGASQPQNNQQQDTELQSVDGSLDLQSSKQKDNPLGQAFGETQLSEVNSVLAKGVRDKTQRQKLYEFITNANRNIGPGFKKRFLQSLAGVKKLYNLPVFTTTGLRYLPGPFDEQVVENRRKTDEKIVELINIADEIKLQDTGVGVVKGVEEGSMADILGGLYNNVVNGISQVIPTMVANYLAPGSGISVIGSQILGPAYAEFNQEKANKIYGKDDPNALEKLFENGEDEIVEPTINGGLQIGLEFIGFKGIDDAIRAIPGARTFLGRVAIAGNREGFTEWGQFGLESVNTARGKGDKLETATLKGVKSMFSKEGIEMWIAGFTGGTTITAGGRAIKAALRSDNNSEKKFNDYVDALYDLKTKRQLTQDKDLQDAYDLEINQIETDFKNFLQTTDKLSEYLTDNQRSDLTNILDAKNNIENKKQNLNTKLNNNDITLNQYNDGLASLESYNQTLNEAISSIKKQALQLASQKQVETVKKAIKDIGLDGKVIEATSSEIEQMDIKDSKQAAGEFGFIRQFKDGGFEIIINKDKPTLGTAAHEFMHAVLFKTLSKNKNIQNELAKELTKYTSTLKGQGVANLINRLSAYENDAALGEEVITVMSESILDGSLKYNEGFFTKVGDILRRFFQNIGLKNVKFNTGRDVFNFIKDYNNSIKTGKVNKAIIQVAKEGAKGKLVDRAQQETKQEQTEETTKFSRSQLVDEINKMQQGAKTKAEFQSRKIFNPIYSSIVNNGGIVNNYIKSLRMSSEKTQETIDSVADRLMNFNPAARRKTKSGKPITLGEFIMSNVGFGKRDAAKKLAIEGAKRTKEVRIDSRPEDSRSFDIADTTTSITEGRRTEQYSKLRRDLGLNKDMMNKVRQAVVKTFGTKLPDVESKKFKSELQKSFRTELKKPIQDMIGSRENYNNFLDKYFQAVYKALPVSTLTQLERNVANDNRIFVKETEKNISPTRVDELVQKGLLPKNTGRTTGPSLFVKQPYPGKNKVMAFFRGVDMENQLGYKVGASTLGTRKDKLAMEIGVELAFDATSDVLKDPAVQEKRKGILELEGKTQAKNERAVIAEKIDRDPEIKFSKDVDNILNIRDLFQLETKGVDKLLNIYDIAKTHNLKTVDGINNFVDDIQNNLLPLMPRDFWFGKPDKNGSFGTVFTPSPYVIGRSKNKILNQEYKDLYNNVFVPAVKRLRSLPDSSFGKPIPGVKDFSISSYDTLFKSPSVIKKNIKNGNIKRFNEKVSIIHREMWNRFNVAIRKDKNNAIVIANYLKMVGAGSSHWHKLGAQFVGYSKQITGTRFEYEHAMPATAAYLYLLDASLSGNNFEASYDLVIDNYKLISLDKAVETKLTKAGLQRIMPKGWSVIDNKWWQRYFNDTVSKIKGGIDPKSIVGLDGKTFAETFDINNEGNSPIVLSSQRTKAINNSKKAIVNRANTIKTGETKGMSTFDFDETVGVSENFVIAKKDNDVKRISSNEWPFVGEQLAAEGYEFDFSDFNKVTKGRPGPLFQKMKNQIAKYGPKNVFILTARAPQSEKAIHDWLASNDINIPRENVTGLGNSTGEAKAQWMLEKFAEGYNDMYFVDDALPNVRAVKEVLDQLDAKSKVVQAKIKFSRDASEQFNEIIEQTKGVHKGKIYSAAEALKLGINKGRYDLLIPPSANDFKGLMYYFMGRGKQGEAHKAWFEENLFKPFAKGIRAWNTYKQNLQNEYASLKKKYPDVVKNLNKKVSGTVYTNDSAIRVYLWEEAGFQIPGLNLLEQKKLSNHVRNDKDLRAFAETLRVVSKVRDGYLEPGPNWVVQTIASDLNNVVERVGRKEFLAEYLANANAIFSNDNLNKIEAINGTRYREALEDILYRMENGTNRIQGSSRIVNGFTEWINASVGAIMFVNIRSALLQTISMVNFINWSDNNVFKAAAAYANQPQFWKDFAMIYNSDQLKQRRKGIRIDVSASELTKTFAEGGTTLLDKTQALLRYLLEKGFTPTQLADSFAIAMGGAPFYRNRFNTYKKQGLSDAQAKEKAMLDFQEIAEETQQSSREDLISQQQASVLGRLILAFQNVTMQMTRLTVKAVSDLVNRRGDWKTNVSKIIYYGAVQNIIFGSLQSALAFVMWGDEEDEEMIKDKTTRVANGVLDSFLRGTGIYGAMVSTLKNVILQTKAQIDAGFGKRDFSKIAVDAVNLSPPIGSKVRKIVSSAKTLAYNKGISKEIGFRIENPILVAAATAVEALTNIPLGRLVNKANNVEEAITGNHKLWQRVALIMGWDRWSLGVKDEELEQAKKDAKETRDNRRKKEKQQEQRKQEEDKRKKGIKKVRCSGINSSGKRCGLTTETTAKTWKCFHHATFKDGMDRDGDGKKEYRCTAKKSNGQRCKNKTENKNKRCYAHQ
tara:strand:+ start:726 stop:7955 length:7230 start_codon:yes stop_codon:yes gene_type:complete